MVKYLTILILICSFSGIYAQKSETIAGPIIKNFGKVYKIKKPELNLQIDKEYKVIFDIYTDTDKVDAVNPLINTVARFLNMHAQNGVPAKNMKVAFVMHGAAAKNALSNDAYQKKYQTDNPNLDLIKALKKADVDIFVCGQSVRSRNLPIDGLSKNVKLSLSALTALVEYQENGYKIINFN
jgi:intracellular sulfur oxidation DsrE/DsrF family protein